MSHRHVGKGGLTRHLLIVFFVLVGVSGLARPASAGTITIGWDPMADQSVTGFRVFVGTRSGAYTQTFDVGADQTFFIFRNAFMGVRYYFAVAAQFDNARIGPRSSEVTSVGTRTVPGGLPEGARVAESSLPSDCGVDCFAVSDLARNLTEISSLAVANDGTVFAVEAGRRVVVVRGVEAVTAFEAAPGTLLRDLALDARYDTSGRVFVSMIRLRDRSAGDIEVVRLRHLAGTLGEAATIVAGPSVPIDALAPVAVGDDGLVYLAVPSMPGRHPYSAAILAFDQDGRVPAGQRSPVASRGLETPRDLAWDAQAGALWLAGEDARGERQVLSLSRQGDTMGVLPDVLAPGERPAGVAVAPGASRRLVVAAGLDLIEAAPGTGDALRISLENYGVPVAVATAGGARYAATCAADDGGACRIVRVDDGNRVAR